MKYRIIVGKERDDGLLTYGDNTFLHLPLIEESAPEWKDIWAINYDDTVDPVLNDVEVTPPEALSDPSNNRPTRDLFMSPDEITFFNNWVETRATEQLGILQANADAEQTEQNELLLAKYGIWGIGHNNIDSNRRNRDGLLMASDSYELPHLKTAEWDTFRQWLRNLPQTNPDPLTIQFPELPAGANQVLIIAYEKWRSRINKVIAIKG